MAKKVFLGVGHGGSDPGAVKYIKEADVNLNMALACRDYLQANGVTVKMSRTVDENDPLTEEISECNAFNPDLAVDIHNNAGGGDGFEVYHYHKGGTSKTLAQNIEAEVKAIGQNSRGLKTRLNSSGSDYYGFIRCIKAPSIICEGVFVDNAADAAQADTLEEQRAFGIAYAKGILKTLGIADKGGNKQDKPTTQNTPTTAQNGLNSLKKGDIVTFTGGGVYKSSTAENATHTKDVTSTCEVTAINTKGTHPYHCISQDGKGVYGWVNAESVKEVSATAQNDPKTVSKGDTVVFTGGPVYKSSTAATATTQKNVTSTCKVTAINTKGTHPYHCISQDGKGVYGWVDKSNIKK